MDFSPKRASERGYLLGSMRIREVGASRRRGARQRACTPGQKVSGSGTVGEGEWVMMTDD